MKSRMEILDDTSKDFSEMYSGKNVKTFQELNLHYDYDFILRVVYQAMLEYSISRK